MNLATLGALVATSLRMNLRRLTTWVFAAAFVLVAVLLYVGKLSVGGMAATGAKLATNAEYTIAVILAAFSFMLVHFTATLTGDPLVKDARLGAAPILRATPVDPRVFVLGKFLGAWSSLLVLYAVFIGALFLGQLLPSGEKLTLPFRTWPYVKFAVLFVLVPTFAMGAVCFAIGTLSGSMKLVYGFATALLVAWMMVSNVLSNEELRYWAWIEPSGLTWMTEKVAKSRGNAWLNTHPLTLDLGFALNRLGLLAVGAAALWVTLVRYPKLDLATDQGGEVRPGLAQRAFAWIRGKQPTIVDRGAITTLQIAVPRAEPAPPGLGTWLAELGASVRTEVRLLLAERSLWIMVPLVMFMCGVNQTTWAGPFNLPIYPVSSEYAQQMVPMLLILLTGMSIFYTGEVFHRDDSNGVRAILYATPVSSSALLLGKLAATLVLSLALALATQVTGVVSQLISWKLIDGRTYVDLAPYAEIGWNVILPAIVILCTGALVINVIVRGRYLAYFTCILLGGLYIWALISGERSLYQNPLAIAHWSYSDMTRLEPFRERLFLRDAFWGSALAGLFALSVYLLLRSEGSWKRFFAPASLRRGRTTLFAALAFAAVAVWVGLWIRARETLRGTQVERERIALELEDRYLAESDGPHLAYESLDLDVDLHPQARALDVRGHLVLCNPYDAPIAVARFTVDPLYTIRRFELERAAGPWRLDGEILSIDLAPPLQRGETARLELDWSGVVNPGLSRDGGPQSTFIQPSATFLSSFNTEVLPIPGVSPDVFLGDEKRRKKHGREKLTLLRNRSGEAFVPSVFGTDKPFHFKARISVPRGQIALTGGNLVERTQRGERDVFAFESPEPIATFPILAARYDVREQGDDAVWFHPAHTYNLDTVLEALRDARASFGRDFGAYSHRSLRIAEFPRLAGFAQSYPTLMPYSESIGFLTNYKDEDNLIDATYFVTAHEVAHQWWGYIAHPGKSLGAQVLSESLAEYSAMLLVEETRGEIARQRFLKREEDAYLRRRDPDREVALSQLEFEGQSSWYNKGCFVFSMLEDVLGRERLIRGLSAYAARWRTGREPAGLASSHPTVQDLLAAIRAQHPGEDLGWFYGQWFDQLIVPDMAVEEAHVRRDGRTWSVDFTATNRREGRMPVEIEAVAGTYDLGRKGEPASKDFRASAPLRLTLAEGQMIRGTLSCDFEPQAVVIDRRYACLDFDRTNNRLEVSGAEPPDAAAAPGRAQD